MVQPVFYYDLGSPYSYLTAERLQQVLPAMPVWQPILLGGIWQQTGGQSWGFTDERDDGIAEVERRAAGVRAHADPLARGLAEQHPQGDARRHLHAVHRPGRGVLARGVPPGLRRRQGPLDVDNVLIAAAACELHPNAVLKALETQSVKDRLREATAEAYERGVRGVPTITVGDELFYGDDRLEEAGSALRGA